MPIKSALPWQVKIAAKLVLSRVGVGYSLWNKLGLFKHGTMDQVDYAYETFKAHYDRVSLADAGPGFVAMELGPGDSLNSALIARSMGAAAVYLVDSGAYAHRDMKRYLEMGRWLNANNAGLPGIEALTSVEEMLSYCHAQYLTSGVSSYAGIPDQSVDVIWSQAVLEHVRLGEFDETLRQHRRLLRPGGVCSHRVDLKDHLSGALNNLRFTEKTWESDFMANSGFYTNRIRYSDMMRRFEDAGFTVNVINVDRWSDLPTPRPSLSAPFQDMPEEELRVSGFDVLLQAS